MLHTLLQPLLAYALLFYDFIAAVLLDGHQASYLKGQDDLYHQICHKSH